MIGHSGRCARSILSSSTAERREPGQPGSTMTGQPGRRVARARRSGHPVAKHTPSSRRSISPKRIPARMRSRASGSGCSASTGCRPSSGPHRCALETALSHQDSSHTARLRILFSLWMPRYTEARTAFAPIPSLRAASLMGQTFKVDEFDRCALALRQPLDGRTKHRAFAASVPAARPAGVSGRGSRGTHRAGRNP